MSFISSLHFLSLEEGGEGRVPAPALLTRISSPPEADFTTSTAILMETGSVISNAKVVRPRSLRCEILE